MSVEDVLERKQMQSILYVFILIKILTHEQLKITNYEGKSLRPPSAVRQVSAHSKTNEDVIEVAIATVFSLLLSGTQDK